ncbi:MAG TPA: hypothetical protein VJG90_09130 [Candidatus Nanoarchaeia archaeon]|nr:hypothetical protein [Candidatus Nanoarchaeia archaeon]
MKAFSIACLFFLFLFKLNFAQATAIGSPIPYEERIVTFRPGLERAFTFRVGQGISIEAYIHPDSVLEPYVKLIDPKPFGGDRTVTVEIKFGDELPPGEHKIGVGARETTSGSGIAAVAAVETAIRVVSLSNNKVITGWINVEDINEGENTTLNVYARSWSYQDVNSVSAEIAVSDATTNKEIARYKTNEISLKSEEMKGMQAIMETKGLKPGWYNAIATILYDGQQMSDGDDFKIGHLQVDIAAYTKELKTNSLNRLDILVNSNWNDRLKEVYGEVELGGKTAKTPTADIPRFGEATLSAYVDTGGMKEGEQPVKITVYYNKESTQRIGSIQLTKKEEAKQEMPKEVKGASGYIYVALLVLVILNILLLLFLKRKKEKPLNPASPR